MTGPLIIGGVAIERIERPADRAELAELLSGTVGPVVPIGGDRWLGITGPMTVDAGASPIGIDLSRLDRVIDFQPDDLTVTVESGVRVNALTKLLAEKGLCVPLAPGGFGLSVGTTVSEARRAAQAALHDGPRRHLLGLTVMNGDGTSFRAGGRVVKNVAGYDLMKLHTGARETLGLITEVTLKLTPIPEVRETVEGTLPDLAAVDTMTRRLVHSDVRPSAWIVMHGEAITFRLELDGFEEDVAAEAGLALAILADLNGQVSARSTRHCREAGLRLFEPISQPAPDSLEMILPSFEIGPIASARRELSDTMAFPGSSFRFDPFLRHGSIAFDLDAPGAPNVGALGSWREQLAGIGVGLQLRSLRGNDDGPPARTLDHALLDGPPPPSISLLRGIKQALDPERRFSPGLHFWGL